MTQLILKDTANGCNKKIPHVRVDCDNNSIVPHGNDPCNSLSTNQTQADLLQVLKKSGGKPNFLCQVQICQSSCKWHKEVREEVVAKQLLMIDPSYLIMVGSCCYATTIIDAWHWSLSLLQGSGLARGKDHHTHAKCHCHGCSFMLHKLHNFVVLFVKFWEQYAVWVILSAYYNDVFLDDVLSNSQHSSTCWVLSICGFVIGIPNCIASGISCPWLSFVWVVLYRWWLCLPLHYPFVVVCEIACDLAPLVWFLYRQFCKPLCTSKQVLLWWLRT